MANYEEARNFCYKSNAESIMDKIRDIWNIAFKLHPQTPLDGRKILLDMTLNEYLESYNIYKQLNERPK